jgi:hypothetical protein
MKKFKFKKGLLILIIIAGFAYTDAFSSLGETSSIKNITFLDKGPKYGEDSAKCVMELSLYREFFRQNNIPDAIKHWRWVFFNCPIATQNTYIDGVKIIEYLISKQKDKINKNKYIDTLMMVYDQRIEYFPNHYRTGRNQVGYILGRKAVDLFKLRPDKYKEAYETFKESVHLEGNRSKAAVLVYYFRSAIKMVEKGDADKSLIVETYDEISDIIDYNIKNNAKYAKEFSKVQDNVELTFEPFANCEDLVSIYSKKFYEDPENIDLLKKITKILDKKDCSDNELFFDAAEMLHKLEPTPESALMMGKMAIKKEMDDKAERYLSEAVKLLEGDELADSYLLLASVLYKKEDYPYARSCAIKAADIRPNDGRPYILIGDIYATAAKRCGDNDLTVRAPYWAAVDKYIKAKSIDESVKDEALRKINIYSKQFPNSETIFFYNLKEGDTYTVECWINEQTTVRAAKN